MGALSCKFISINKTCNSVNKMQYIFNQYLFNINPPKMKILWFLQNCPYWSSCVVLTSLLICSAPTLLWDALELFSFCIKVQHQQSGQTTTQNQWCTITNSNIQERDCVCMRLCMYEKYNNLKFLQFMQHWYVCFHKDLILLIHTLVH